MALDPESSRALMLRVVISEDCRMIWEWANDPSVRSVSFSPEPIPWESHCKWFFAKLVDPNCLFFMVLGHDEQPIGQIRYELDGNEAVVSVAFASGQRGKGYGSQAIRAASREVFESTSVRLIHAYIKPDNSPSLRAFTKAGFTESGSVEMCGSIARHYILHRKYENR